MDDKFWRVVSIYGTSYSAMPNYNPEWTYISHSFGFQKSLVYSYKYLWLGIGEWEDRQLYSKDFTCSAGNFAGIPHSLLFIFNNYIIIIFIYLKI